MSSRPLILLADDDRDLLNALRIRLLEHDFEVATASDSYGALAIAVEKHPDLMVLDINMPAGDGFSVQERLRQLEPLSNVPVIYVTGDKSERLDDVAEQFGAAELFHKPFDTDVLAQRIREILLNKAA